MPSTRTEFGQYCLRKLGHPVIQINVSPEQIDDRIDEALQLWHERHMDGSFETIIKHQITEEDKANGYITLPDNLLRVEKVLPIRSSMSSHGMFDIQYQLHLNDIFDLRHAGTMSNYVMTKQYLGFVNDVLNGNNIVEFTKHRNRLEIQMNWSRFPTGTWIIMYAELAVTPDNDPGVWDDLWLKKYATALIKRQWGDNLSKFAGIEMLGGVTMDGPGIYSSATAEVERLEAELTERYELPPMFFVG